MEWRDPAIVLSARRHGDSSLVVSLLTSGHGRHAGLAKGGAGKAARGLFQPGNVLLATWKARLEDQLGVWSCELLEANAAAVLGDPGRLAALASVCALAEAALPEREAHPAVYDATLALMGVLSADEAGTAWAEATVRWEMMLLAEMGFGLDLTACAATGATEELVWVSPRTGRAVSAAAGAPYRDRLLPLPGFLTGEAEASPAALRQGFALTGFFLERHVLAQAGRPMPPARQRLVDRMGA